MQINWKKTAAGAVSSKVGPLLIKLEQTGDGRWSWQVFNGEAQNPMATGIAGSLGAAKTSTTQFAQRTGLI